MNQLFAVLCFFSISSIAQARFKPRIIGGDFGTKEQFPYQVSLQTVRDYNTYPICGGGIINKRFILTAAHCVVNNQTQLNKSNYHVVGGSTDLNDLKAPISVRKVYVLKSYSEKRYEGDIAVLELKENIDFNNGLRKLKLPKDDQNYVGQTARIAGYGWNLIEDWEHGGSDYKLRYFDVNIITNEECRQQFINVEADPSQRIHDSIMCGQAVTESDGVCKGDSGGPLVLGQTVIGVVSQAGSGVCAENVIAARYTRVSSFVKFINDVMKGVKSPDVVVHTMS